MKTNASENKQADMKKGVSSKEEKVREIKREINKNTKSTKNNTLRTNNQRTRNIPTATRDKVFARDGGKCTFVGENGKRCDSTWNLEIDHIVPFARGGDNSPGNLRLLCAKHNLVEAERVYGRDFMKKYTKRE
jgi:5-methylcytosine-specific restriction endonuclease McrA